jgi:hypothetical protein
VTGLSRFLDRPTSEVHPAYAGSMLSRVAPEYTTGDGLVAAAYRTILLGVQDREVDLETIPRLPGDLGAAASLVEIGLDSPSALAAFVESWRDLVGAPGGLTSPTPAGSPARLPQLTPLVPNIAHRSGVIGKFGRGRWQPGTLVLSAIWSGAGPDDAPGLVTSLADALAVGPDDDLFARYVETTLALVHEPRVRPPVQELAEIGRPAAAWRVRGGSGHTPAERFASDLGSVIELKGLLTRRQWTALLEAQLRLGLATHQMWLCRLNARVWSLCVEALNGAGIDHDQVLATCWRDQESDEPFLELGADSESKLRRLLAEYARARLGINLVLFALDELGVGWDGKVGAAGNSWSTPSEAVTAFLDHVRAHSTGLNARFAEGGSGSALAMAGELADSYPRLLSGQLGVTRNLLFFLRYTLGQLQPVDEEFASYDQGFLVHRPSRSSSKERLVRPGPGMLILIVHNACRSLGGIPASMDVLRRHLRAYGLGASADELRAGATIRELERLELVVDSPDAGGGRSLVDPLPVPVGTNA